AVAPDAVSGASKMVIPPADVAHVSVPNDTPVVGQSVPPPVVSMISAAPAHVAAYAEFTAVASRSGVAAVPYNAALNTSVPPSLNWAVSANASSTNCRKIRESVQAIYLVPSPRATPGNTAQSWPSSLVVTT